MPKAILLSTGELHDSQSIFPNRRSVYPRVSLYHVRCKTSGCSQKGRRRRRTQRQTTDARLAAHHHSSSVMHARHGGLGPKNKGITPQFTAFTYLGPLPVAQHLPITANLLYGRRI